MLLHRLFEAHPAVIIAVLIGFCDEQGFLIAAGIEVFPDLITAGVIVYTNILEGVGSLGVGIDQDHFFVQLAGKSAVLIFVITEDDETNIVDVVYCDSQYEKSRKLTLELMEKYPNLKMIAGMNEYSSVGAARAVKAAGAKKRIQVVGVDSSQEAVQLMENGVFKGLVVQKAFKMGYMGVKETVRMLRGKSYDKDVNSGCELVTPDNMYSSEIEKLLFPFNTLRLS